MALIVATTLPLAIIASLLAWHSYEANKDNSIFRAERNAQATLSEISNDIDRTHSVLDMLAGNNISTKNALHEFNLIQTLSQYRYCSLILTDKGGVPITVLPPPSIQDPKICQTKKINPFFIHNKNFYSNVGIEILEGEVGPLLRFVAPIINNNSVNGFIISTKNFVWQSNHIQSDYIHLYSNSYISKSNHYLITQNGDAFSFLPDHPEKVELPIQVKNRINLILKTHTQHDAFTIDDIAYVFQNAYGSINLLITTERTPAEKKALHIFVIRVGLIVLLLTLELIVVAWAARTFLVQPIERLALAVFNWKEGDTFISPQNRFIPLENQHLEKAFITATKRLSRHEKALEESARNQDLLIKEIHHRVKNNLQIVASLLNLQANRIRSQEAREEFHLVRDRVRALATLHRYLYSDKGLSGLNIHDFLEELSTLLLATYDMHTQTRIRLKLDVDHILIAPDQAVPIALIVTEVISNALRFAFPEKQSGYIRISLKQSELSNGEKNIEMILGDNGIGFRANDPDTNTRREGIGIQLIRGFSRQIDADLTINNQDGTWYIIKFQPSDPLPSAISLAQQTIQNAEKNIHSSL
ncbi:sensor histidine kinase [Swingsia samuiensis]|nr:sensor histidine kinase [Swingsia samuiensis]